MKLIKHYTLILVVVLFTTSCSKKDVPTPQPTLPPTTPPAGSMSITSISPDYGKAGTEITINGANFSATAAGNVVTLGGKAATVKSATTTQLKINAPADATHGTISLKVGTETASSAMFYYEPILTSLSATTGKAGDVIVITGQHFGTAVADFEVKFNGTLAEITAATATTLSVKVPTGSTAGLLTVARKTKTPVSGPTFTISAAPGGATTGFTINNSSVTITKLVTNDGGYGQVLCMTIDDNKNVAYAATKDDIIKIDLATNFISSIIKNSTYLKIAYGEPSAIDVDANGNVYVYASTYGVTPTTGSNVYMIDPVAKTAIVVGNRFVGYSVTPNGSFGINTPFVVMGNGEIIAFDKTNKELCKFSADLSTRTVIYTLPLALESFVQLIKVNPNTVRIVLFGLSGKYYYDYSGTIGSKTDFNVPTGINMISQSIGGTSKYGVAGLKIEDPNNTLSGQPRTTYTVGRLNAAQTAWEKSGSFIIENLNQANNIKYYDFIGLNGKNYFYADKNGNMYAHILGSNAATSGIYKIAMN